VFLPLPISTGLPIHINGFFEISENRQSLWLADHSIVGAGRVKSGAAHTCF
jgi:sacsin